MMKQDILKSGLKALYYSGAHRLLAPFTQGTGLIFMLHQVTPGHLAGFAPNGILQVEPDFLDAVLEQVRASGLDIVTLDEARERIVAGDMSRRFACFTLDDGYRDNLLYALPVFKKHEAPFTVYVPSSFADGRGELWWLALEQVIAHADALEVDLGSGPERLASASVGEKQIAYHRVYWWLRKIGEAAQRTVIRDLCSAHGVDQRQICRDLVMTWEEVRRLAEEPLATIGAHTENHFAVGKLPEDAARRELERGAEKLAEELGERPRHLSYPYGDAESAGPRDFDMASELGFETAVTTRKGVVFPEHRDHLTALPRVSLNGAYQSLLYTRLYLTGAPFALWNGFRKVDAG